MDDGSMLKLFSQLKPKFRMCSSTYSYAFLVGLIILLCFVCDTLCHCSEAHRQTCSYPYLKLQQLNVQMSPNTAARYVPDYNQTTLRQVCDLFSEYRNCSQVFLPSCNQQALEELQMFDLTLGLICGDLFQGYLRHKACIRQFYSSYKACKSRQMTAIHNTDLNSGTYKAQLCRTATEYTYCVFTATALGCSLWVAEDYFKLLNRTISNIFQWNSYSCFMYYPMDVISLYTTTPSTVPTTHTRTSRSTGPNTSVTPKEQTISSARTFQPMHILCYFLLMLFTTCHKCVYNLGRMTTGRNRYFMCTH